MTKTIPVESKIDGCRVSAFHSVIMTAMLSPKSQRSMNQSINLHTPQHQSHLNDMYVVISLQSVFLCCVDVRGMAEEIQNRFNQIVCLEIEWTSIIL